MHIIERNDCEACVAVAVIVIPMQICLRPEASSCMLRSGQRKHGCLYVRSLNEPKSSGVCAQNFTEKTRPSSRYVYSSSFTIRVVSLVRTSRTSVCCWLFCFDDSQRGSRSPSNPIRNRANDGPRQKDKQGDKEQQT